MRRWKSQASSRLWLAIALFVLAAAGAITLLARIGLALDMPPVQWEINLGLYLQLLMGLALLLAAGIFAYRVAATLTLSYGVDRNGFYILWLGNRTVVPLAQIESVESGASLPEVAGSRANSIGYFHGSIQLPEGKVVQRFTTVPLAQALILHTTGDSFAISPENPETFVQELEQRRRIGVIQQLSTGVEAGRMFFYAFWDDRVVRTALLSAVGLSLLLVGWLAAIYPGLPPMIDLRADAAGMAMALHPRHQVLSLPLAAVAIILINSGFGMSLYSRTPVGARLLQVASALIQVLFAVALLTIVI
ncbi:MAG: PH domain-containing protein [Chloroflexales bacterium]